MSEPIKPFLKWAGGKVLQAQRISAMFGGPPGRRYIEPFAGAGAVFFHRAGKGEVRLAVLADVNPHLMGCHMAVANSLHDLQLALRALPWGTEWRASYPTIRDAFNAGNPYDPVQAARFIWLNRACFNGLFRMNQKGEFNVPAGDYPAIRPPEVAHLEAASRCYQSAALFCGDFRDVLGDVGRGDQVYADPPFVSAKPPKKATSKGSGFTAYTDTPFNMDTQLDLARLLSTCAQEGANVIASNHDTQWVRDTYRGLGFTPHEIEAKRSVGRPDKSAATRSRARELLLHQGAHPVPG